MLAWAKVVTEAMVKGRLADMMNRLAGLVDKV
jgi:hypothetical protein